jgi:hypothetical protein
LVMGWYDETWGGEERVCECGMADADNAAVIGDVNEIPLCGLVDSVAGCRDGVCAEHKPRAGPDGGTNTWSLESSSPWRCALTAFFLLDHGVSVLWNSLPSNGSIPLQSLVPSLLLSPSPRDASVQDFQAILIAALTDLAWLRLTRRKRNRARRRPGHLYPPNRPTHGAANALPKHTA